MAGAPCTPLYRMVQSIIAFIDGPISGISKYRGQVDPWVKGSVPVFFLKLHHRGERGRKGKGVQISK